MTLKAANEKTGRSIKLEVSRQTRELIASERALAQEHVRILETGLAGVSRAMEGGLETLSWNIQEVSRGIGELNSSFHWAFGEMIGELTRLNSAVPELVKIAKTPAQTAANEHFQIAREAFRQQLYAEAIEEAEKAIERYKLEWRFHSLIGTIRLGNLAASWAAYCQGSMGRALTHVEEALKLNPLACRRTVSGR
jgi:tetratricopeptide (TPR) repeat protein